MFSVLSGHSVQPLADSRHGVMEGLRKALPTAENHLPDLWPDLENRLRPAASASHFKSSEQPAVLDGEHFENRRPHIPTESERRTKRTNHLSFLHIATFKTTDPLIYTRFSSPLS